MKIEKLKRIYVLGPEGTNSEKAIINYLRKNNLEIEVLFTDTLENAAEKVIKDKESAFLGCVAYPNLHNLIFPYLDILSIEEVFLEETYEMVLASNSKDNIETIATHPAPAYLCDSSLNKCFSTSNADAAQKCLDNTVDACITTTEAIKNTDLLVLDNYGSFPMGFTIHMHKNI